jgi:toxin YoeB
MIEELRWTREAWSDYVYWLQHNAKTRRRINGLVLDAARDPFVGVGKPEPLRGTLSGFWSRNIDMTNSLLYAVDDARLTIISCRYHVKVTMVFSGS